PQPVSRALALARRRLSRLECAPFRPAPCTMERGCGPRARAGRRIGGPSRRRPSARLRGIARSLPRQAESLHDAAGRSDARARRALLVGPPRALAACAVSALLRVARRIPRRERRPGPHRKRARVRELERAGVPCETLDLADAMASAALLRDGTFTHVAHLAAQPGVRYSLINPGAYLRNNIDVFGAVLEGCRHAGVAHLVY